MQRLVAFVRMLAGLREDDAWSPLHIAIYAALGLIAVVLLIAWLTGASLACVGGGVCS